MTIFIRLLLIASLFTVPALAQSDPHGNEHSHEHHDEHRDEHRDQEPAGHDDGHQSDAVLLSPAQRRLAAIRVTPLQPRRFDYQVFAPAEIKANGYTSYRVSPRADSVVLRRHVSLGDHVEQQQPLITLFSAAVAEAQAAFQVAHAEWQRVQALSRSTAGEQRFVQAQSRYQAALARLHGYGLSKPSIQALTTSANVTLGEYTLTAAIAGAVLSDDFYQGQRLTAGQTLIELADEKSLWVEARLPPEPPLTLPAGLTASVKVGSEQFPATVSQQAHIIDPQTRTRVVRLTVANDRHRLHSGLFAEVRFAFVTDQPVLAVPETALMRSADGDWTVFVETAAGAFQPQAVTLGRSLGQWREISGIGAGSPVVIEGAFYVAAEIAKGSFDPHNH